MVVTDTIWPDAIGTHTERPQGLVEDQVVYGALAAISQALEPRRTNGRTASASTSLP